MKFKSKFVACAVSLVLAFGSVPVAAFAAPADTNAAAEAAQVETQDQSKDQTAETADATQADSAAVTETDAASKTDADKTATEEGTPEASKAAAAAEAEDEAVAETEAAKACAQTANEDEQTAADDTATAQAASLTTGVAMTIGLADTKGVLDVAGGSLESEADVQVYPSNDTPAQHFRLHKDASSGAYYIINVLSGKALDVRDAVAEPGTAIQQYTSNKTAAQLWDIEELEDGEYALVSRLSDKYGSKLYLTADGSGDSGALTIEEHSLNARQSFTINEITQPIDDGLYTITLAARQDLSLDIDGASWSSGANAQVYSANGSVAQVFQLTYEKETGYYKILSASNGKALDVDGASSANGANVQQYSSNNTYAQRWSVVETAVGYVIKNSTSTRVLDVADGVLKSGQNVQQYGSNGTAAQLWSLNEASIPNGAYAVRAAASSDYVLDVKGASISDGANVQLYSGNGTKAQEYIMTDADEDGYYTLRNVGSGKFLTVYGTAAKGASVVQQSYSGSDSQLWEPQVVDNGIILMSKTGFALDIAGASYKNGTNIQVYTPNETAAQNFILQTLPNVDVTVIDFSSQVGDQTVTSTPINQTSYLFLPSTADPTSVPLSFVSELTGNKLMVSSRIATGYKTIASGTTLNLEDLGAYDETEGGYVLYTKTSNTASVVKLVIMVSSDVPTMYIVSDDPANEGRAYVESSSDHSAKAKATMMLVEPDGTVTYGESASAITIKGRGNSTWAASAKKPYQIKLDKKTDLLNTGDSANKNKTWVLLANAGDATMLHNTIAYNLALELGMAETTQSESIDLYYDGEYRGTYLLSEKVEVASGRVDIDSLDDANEEANPEVDFSSLTLAQATNKYGKTYQYSEGMTTPESYDGGYLIEMDSAYYSSEPAWFQAGDDTYVTKNPEYMSKDEAKYISELFQEALNSLNSSGVNSTTGKSVSDYFDLDSLAKTYLVNELCKNIDSFCTSTYFYKKAGEDKFYVSPVWDFDTSLGMRNENTSEGIGYTYAGFFTGNRTFMTNALKASALRTTINSVYTDELNSIITDIVCSDEETSGTFVKSIVSYSNQIASSQAMNAKLWGVSNFSNCIPAFDTWEKNVEYTKNWVKWRNQWLFSQISSWTSSSYSTANTATSYDGEGYELVFDAETYLSTYADLRAAFGTDDEAALEHFVNYGMAEGRQASANFNVYAYKARYADLRAAFGDDLKAYYTHYIDYGFAEGRTAV